MIADGEVFLDTLTAPEIGMVHVERVEDMVADILGKGLAADIGDELADGGVTVVGVAPFLAGGAFGVELVEVERFERGDLFVGAHDVEMSAGAEVFEGVGEFAEASGVGEEMVKGGLGGTGWGG